MNTAKDGENALPGACRREPSSHLEVVTRPLKPAGAEVQPAMKIGITTYTDLDEAVKVMETEMRQMWGKWATYIVKNAEE